MTDKIIAPPVVVDQSADKFTKQAPDYTGPSAENRILHISCPWFKYGTEDKGHAAALVLSGLILLVSLFGGVIGAFTNGQKWVEILMTWLGSAFLFTAGIAVGGGAAKSKDKRSVD